ncbi:MAG: single-stranded DNA-binding protein [Thiohalocapsa sp.]|nr:single-stranded DNA-binding protein [Thiohalocapsa sp.]
MPAQAPYQTTEQHSVVLLGMLAEALRPQLVGGASLYVEGMIRKRKLGSADGLNRAVSEIVARKPDAAQIIENDAETHEPPRKPAPRKPREETAELEDVPF